MTVRRLVIALALVLAFALGLSIYRFNVSTDTGVALSGATEAEFVRSAIDGCIARQKASPDNAGVEPQTIASYCACYATALAGRVTSADLERLGGQNAENMRALMTPKMAESEKACFSKLDEKD